jgi:hypothetical protein
MHCGNEQRLKVQCSENAFVEVKKVELGYNFRQAGCASSELGYAFGKAKARIKLRFKKRGAVGVSCICAFIKADALQMRTLTVTLIIENHPK